MNETSSEYHTTSVMYNEKQYEVIVNKIWNQQRIPTRNVTVHVMYVLLMYDISRMSQSM